MKKTAVLLDLGFVSHKLFKLLGNRHPNANEVRGFALKCLTADEELFRIYCYDCFPYAESQKHPLTSQIVNFANTNTYKRATKLLHDLRISDNIAFRYGELIFNGWILKKYAVDDILKTHRNLQPDDFKPDLKQKLVDMKIGLDVAWLASKGIVDRIILVTADSDFIPAMKFARREGVQVVLVVLGHKQVKRELKEHADELRTVTFP